MISYLKGIIQSKEPDSLTLNVSGVGYELFVPLFVWQSCKVKNHKALYVHTHVKENELSLFGFESREDKRIFKLLISVSGIGPKLSLTILSFSNNSKSIVKAIADADVAFFENIKGIGKKASQRIIIDLKNKIGSVKELEFETLGDKDLIEALRGLGFSSGEIKKSIAGLKKNLSLEEKIKQALKKA